MEPEKKLPQDYEVLDLSRAMSSFKREQIRKILELPDHRSFSIVRWYAPAEARPIEATYIIAKLYEPGIGVICADAAYERGRFWELDPFRDEPLKTARVLAWSYPPLDDRVDGLGQLRYLGS